MILRGQFALVLCAGLAACAPVAPDSHVVFQPDAQGLAVHPVGKRIDFGRSPKGVIPILDRERGAHERLTLDGCPGAIHDQLRWRDLVLTFTREQFVGWRLNGTSQGQVCS